MNFFEAQAKAKKHTFMYVLLFMIAIGGLVVLTNITIVIAMSAFENELNITSLEMAIAAFEQYASVKMWLISSAIVLLIVGSGSLYMKVQLSKGGEFVASSLGGRKVNTNTDVHEERQLLNVVEEMAIASGIAVPSVYILNDHSINAFAAGHSTDDVVIGVTQGLMDLLDRDELQGVIAHEFSHIFNGDMKINMRLTSTLHGILLVGLIGEMILRGMLRGGSSTRGTQSKSKSSGSGLMIIVFVAVAFYIIGSLGKLTGGWIKAIISRKREYLADASAVQYTRYPQGIAGALKKIGNGQTGSEIRSSQSSTYSHLYFASGVSGFFSSMFATHPPLAKRILAIDPRWNGIYPKIDQKKVQKEKADKRSEKREKKEQMAAVITSATVGAKMASIGHPQESHLEYAKKVKASLSDEIKDKLNDALGAQTLILALLTDRDRKLQERQINVLPSYMTLEFNQSFALVQGMQREQYLDLVKLAMPALKLSSKEQYKSFKSYMSHFIEIDKKVTLLEWCLQHIVLRPLDKAFGLKTEIKMVHSTIGGVREELQILFSMLAQAQYKDEDEAKAAFDRIKKEIELPVFEYVLKKDIRFKQFSAAIAALETVKIPVKKRIMEASLAMMYADDKLSLIEYEMIHAIAEVLELPLPPLSAG